MLSLNLLSLIMNTNIHNNSILHCLLNYPTYSKKVFIIQNEKIVLNFELEMPNKKSFNPRKFCLVSVSLFVYIFLNVFFCQFFVFIFYKCVKFFSTTSFRTCNILLVIWKSWIWPRAPDTVFILVSSTPVITLMLSSICNWLSFGQHQWYGKRRLIV